MGQFINHYSFPIFLVPALALVLYILLRGEGARWKQILAVLMVALVTVVFFLFNPGESPVGAIQAQEQLATTGKPVLVEFYSDY